PAARALGYPDSRDWWVDRGHHGEVLVIENQGPWHPRSNGSRAHQPQPYSTASGDFKTNFSRNRDWHRRTLRRRRADYSNWRGDGIAGGTDFSYHRFGAEGSAGVWSSRRHVGDVQYSDCGRNSCHRVIAI